MGGQIGRQDYTRDEQGKFIGGISTDNSSTKPSPNLVVKPVSGEYENLLVSDMQKKSDQVYELGWAYFREGRWSKAMDCFEMVMGYEPDRSRGYIADVWAAYQSNSYNRASFSLLRAMKHAQSLDDLRIDNFVDRLFTGETKELKEQEFKRTVESVSMLAASAPEAVQANLLLSYFAWLNGDNATAIKAAGLVEQKVDPDYADGVGRFRRLLAEAVPSIDSASSEK